MKYIIRLAFCIYLLASGHILFAQHPVKGKVLDENGTTLIGVNVTIQNDASRATQTNSNGEFTISAAGTDTIVFEYIGFAKTSLSVKQVLAGPIRLKEDYRTLDEIVVIAYGEVKRSDLTGAVGTVNVEEMTKAPVMSMEEMLAGRVSGVQVSSNSGQPGDETNIVVRGGNSITQDNSPLYVVDGVSMEDFDMGSLNPADIENISILKDASSTAIYGARGANGVIVITTKRGKQGGTSVYYDGIVSLSEVSRKMDVMDPYEYIQYQLERIPTQTRNRFLMREGIPAEAYKYAPFLDWQDMLFRTAPSQLHTLSLQGGGSDVRYLVSGNLVQTEGIIINSGRNRTSLRMNLSQNVSKKWSYELATYYTHDKNWGQPTAEEAGSDRAYATYLMYRTWGYKPTSWGSANDILEDLYDDDDSTDDVGIMHPIITTQNEIRHEARQSLFLNGGVTYRFTDNLQLKVTGGYNRRNRHRENFYNSMTYQGRTSPNNVNGQNGGYSDDIRIDWLNENTLSYKKTLNQAHNIDALVGMTVQGTDLTTSGARVINVENEEFGLNALQYGMPFAVRRGETRNTLLSYLARANYNYKSKYLFTATMRADGSSKFSRENQWGYFPSFAVAWNIARERFLERSELINEAKLRFSYGVTGNNRMQDFIRYQMSDFDDFYSTTGGSPIMVLYPNSMGNYGIRWESTAQTGLGLDLSLFKNRVHIVTDLYRKVTDDLLLNANIPSNFGYNKAMMNIGSVENKGVEFTVQTINLNGSKFKWMTDFNIAYNKNKVLALTMDENSFATPVSFAGGNFSNTPLYLAEVGAPVARFYGLKWDGIYQYEDFDQQPDGSYTLKSGITDNGQPVQPGDIKYVDQDGDYTITDADRVVLGDALPKHFGGLSNTFVYKRFSFNVFFQWNYGNKVMNANRIFLEGNPTNRPALNQFASYANRWTPDNPSNEHYRVGGGGPTGVFSDKTLEDGSYLRLRTVRLSYDIPTRWARGINKIQVHLSGQNLHTWTNYSGVDPEVSIRNTILTPGFDYSAYARSRVYAFGCKIEF